MRKIYQLFSILLQICFCAGLSAQDNPGVIDITTLPGLQFDKVQVAVKPGEEIRLTFSNRDDMSHNLLIVKPGKRVAVVEAALALAEKGPELSYIPPSDDVLWHIPVISPGEKRTITFVAPAKEGAYPFVCTYPGHGFVMYGVMHVSAARAMPPLAADPDVPEARKKTEMAQHAGHHHGAPKLHPYDPQPPYLYRGFMEESGLASIAVRLPGELAFCWDAGACRLRYAWSGEFVDNTNLWHGHKNAYSKVLGEIFYKDKSAYPLRIGKPDLIPTVVFKGYRMVDRYPEFRYLVNGVEVRELIREKKGGKGLERRFSIPYGLEPVWFSYGEDDGVTYEFPAGKPDGATRIRFSPSEARDFVVIMTRSTD